MFTIVAIPKPFDDGHIAMIQRNALRSWSELEGAEVLLIGDDEGVADAARDVGAQHAVEVQKNAYGTPLVSSAFELARKISKQRLLVFVNADIVLLPDFAEWIRSVRYDDFLLVGQRWNVDVCEPILFDDPDWEKRLRAAAADAGDLSSPHWIDYFVLPRESALIEAMPPFVIGRPKWDNWMLRQARRLQIPVIDATPVIEVVHQRHDYAHVPEATGEQWEGPEASANTDLFGGGPTFGIWHSSHVLTRRGPRRALGGKYLRERWETRDEADGRVEGLGRLVDPALAPARWVYRRRHPRPQER
jgi:hypothetical protein